ncbi:MAG: sulfite exporter TauE/SafE family protein [Brevirhabdus sp.]
MPEPLAAALAHDGLALLAVTVFVAGLVRGFAGFGTALVYLPVAASVLEPVWAIITVVIFDLVGPALILPRALRDGHPRDLMRLLAGCAIGLPIGLALLFVMAPDLFRYAVSIVSLLMLAALLLGLRYKGVLSKRMIYGTGFGAGVLGGVAGVPGPPVILLYMASPHPARVVRGNTTSFLFFYDVMILAFFLAAGRMQLEPVILGAVLAVPNALGNLAGAAIFRPGHERSYRAAAYFIIAVSAISGLPLLDG